MYFLIPKYLTLDFTFISYLKIKETLTLITLISNPYWNSSPSQRKEGEEAYMAIIGDALRQAFMPKHEYESLREEDKAWTRLQRPILIGSIGIICLAIFVCTVISLKILFPRDVLKRPFCDDWRLQPLPLSVKGGGTGDSDLLTGAFYLTDQETVDYYWMVVFIPSMVIFLASVAYLVAGQ